MTITPIKKYKNVCC